MTRDELEHAIRAACDVADDTELFVFGSQAILGPYPDAPEALRQSAEVDLVPKNRPENTDRIDSALGNLSAFHETYGFYVHGVPLEAAILPEGWEGRLVEVRNDNTNQCTGWCVEGHDLAASKLVPHRDKDLGFVRVLLAEGLIEEAILVARVRALDVPPHIRQRLATWVEVTCRELD